MKNLIPYTVFIASFLIVSQVVSHAAETIYASADRMLGNADTSPGAHETGTTAWLDTDGQFAVGDNYVERDDKVTEYEWRAVMEFDIASATADIKSAQKIVLQVTMSEIMGEPYSVVLMHLEDGNDGEVKISDYHAVAEQVGDAVKARDLALGSLQFDVTKEVKSDLFKGVSAFRLQVEAPDECPNENKRIDAVKFYDASSGKNPYSGPQLILE